MIGGYVYHRIDNKIHDRLAQLLLNGLRSRPVGSHGLLFHDEPFARTPTSFCSSDGLALLTQDLLACCDAGGEYRSIDVGAELGRRFINEGMGALDGISSDFRLAAVDSRAGGCALFLASNRAGAGRIYYHRLEAGVLFSSDLRLLLRVVPLDIEDKAIYALLKYGAIPEPMTISRNIAAVPPAHYLRYDAIRNSHSLHPYFKLAFTAGGRSSGADHALAASKSILRQSARFLSTLDPAILLSGGIDSSLFACYLRAAGSARVRGAHCTFGPGDVEFEYARSIARVTGADFHVGEMNSDQAWPMLSEAVRLTDHPFSDFSSLPVVFILKFIRERMEGVEVLIECNGGDDCFGFPALTERSKYAAKASVPRPLKRAMAALLERLACWKWESHGGLAARLAALADVHEIAASNYFLVLTPVNYLALGDCRSWDREISELMEGVFRGCSAGYDGLGYEAVTTVKQLMHVNSRRWAAKALSVGEGLGIRCVYPYIWREVLIEQGRLPWSVKVHNGIVKWPLKRLLEEFMPEGFVHRKKSGFVPPFAGWIASEEFNRRARAALLAPGGVITRIVPPRVVDSLLADALNGRPLRHAILNFLWGALFTELWVREHAPAAGPACRGSSPA